VTSECDTGMARGCGSSSSGGGGWNQALAAASGGVCDAQRVTSKA